MIIAIAPNGRPKSHPYPEAYDRGRCLVVVIVVLYINRGGIGRHINNLRICRLHLNDGVRHVNDLALIHPFHRCIGGRDYLLGTRLQGARFLGLGSQRLDGVHQVHRLIYESAP
jgi:hypothetical protein